MNNDLNPEIATTAIQAVQPIVTELYKDALQPIAQQTGKALGTIGGAINALMSPLQWMIYGFNHINEVVQEKLSYKLEDVPPEKLIPPPPNIAVPTYQSLIHSLGIDELREMYINLLASSMNTDTKENAHPAFVEIIKQLSTFDAKLFNDIFTSRVYSHPIAKVRAIKDANSGVDMFLHITIHSANLNHLDFKPYSNSIDNLLRLKLISVDYTSYLVDINEYSNIENTPLVNHVKQLIVQGKHSFLDVKVCKGILSITPFGESFFNACIKQIF